MGTVISRTIQQCFKKKEGEKRIRDVNFIEEDEEMIKDLEISVPIFMVKAERKENHKGQPT